MHFNKDLINIFANTYEFFNEDINNLTLLLRKGVYPYEYMESWERFDETPYLNKEDFYSNLYMEIITDVDYRRAKIVQKKFKMNSLGDYDKSYVQSDKLLLADAFEHFKINVLKYINLILLIFYLILDQHDQHV